MNKILLIIYLFFSLGMLHAQTADFTYKSKSGLYCNPATIQFSEVSTGDPVSFVWDFGNGENSNSPGPEVRYDDPGIYNVKLLVIYPQKTLTVTKTVTVNASISTAIKSDKNYICNPGIINFTAVTNGNIAGYDWDFGDGPGTNTTNKNITHNYTSPGLYNVRLKATDVSGCIDTNHTSILIQLPPINGTASIISGCLPAIVGLTANVEIPVNSTVTKYSWDFRDGSPLLVTATGNVNHTYINPGNYLPAVTITTSEGCTNKYSFDPIAFGTAPSGNNAYAVKSQICASDTAFFISKAADGNSYTWKFGDGRTSIARDTFTKHKYSTLGIKNVTVTPAYNGCVGSTSTFQIEVVGVIAFYNYSNSCADKKTFSFRNTSQGHLSSFLWDFGDGSPVENTRDVIHTYPASGTFVTTLTVTDDVTGCSDTYSKNIYTSQSSLVNPDVSICRNSVTTFSVINTSDDPANTYTWNVAGAEAGPFKEPSYIDTATIMGNHNNYVIISSGSRYCKDTVWGNNTLLVRGPKLDFTSPASICLNSPYGVTNISQPSSPGDPVNIWYWNFGQTEKNDSIYKPPPHVYNNPGTYLVKLTGIDINGCRDTLDKMVTVDSIPFLYVTPRIDTLCSGQADTLIAFHTDDITWSASNTLSCATCDTVISQAIENTAYIITAANKFGCTVIDSISVTVISPFIAGTLFSDTSICLNGKVQLDVSPPGKKIVWFPATGLSNAQSYRPMASPSSTTTYIGSLTDSLGCSTAKDSVLVKVQLPFTASALVKDTSVCVNGSIQLDVGPPGKKVVWFPVAGLLNADSYRPTASPDQTTAYTATLTDSSGCFSSTATIVIKVIPPFVASTILYDTSICLHENIQLNVDPPGKRIAWSPATGLSSANSYGPIASPAQTTTYTATLSDSVGCSTSLASVLVTVIQPFVASALLNEVSICPNGSAQLDVYPPAKKVVWFPAAGLSGISIYSPVASPAESTTYIATLTDSLGCFTGIASTLVKVIPPLIASVPVTDVYICINNGVQLHVDPPGEKIVWSPVVGLSNGNNYEPTASPAQNTTYTATLTDSLGCATSSVNINVHINTPPRVDAGPDKEYPLGSPFSINPTYSNNISSYSWNPPNILSCNSCAYPAGIATVPNTFSIEVTSDSGCLAKDEIAIYVKVACKDANLLLPSAFTPNGDNLNDRFFPSARGVKSITSFSIYNRYGNLVYEAKNFPPNDKAFGWDGKLKNEIQPISVFVYSIEAICDSGEKLHKNGSFTLIR